MTSRTIITIHSSISIAMELINLNACCGGGDNDSSTPNAWENPGLTGMNRLAPHSRNIRAMATAYQHQNGIKDHNNDIKQDNPSASVPPCICLDSSALESTVVTGRGCAISSTNGWKFRLFPDPLHIPSSYITSNSSTSKDVKFCSKPTSVPSNWTMQAHKECCGVHDPHLYIS